MSALRRQEWSVAGRVAGLVFLGVATYPVTRLRAWWSYMHVLASTITSTSSDDPLRDVANVARALEGWDAAPAIARILHAAVSRSTRAVRRAGARAAERAR
jgi:hypothetical protein